MLPERVNGMAGHAADHFAHYPTHLFALLVVMALSKSTVLVSSVLPPASVMLMAGIAVSQSSLHPGMTWLAVVMGATAGSVLNYHIGQLMGHTRLASRLTAKHADKFLRVQHQLQKHGVVALFTSRFWRCCVISCRWRPACSG